MKIKDLPKIDKPRGSHPSAGHRERLRERFLQSGLSGFLDYEIVELLLTLGTPRKDCKQIAKEAIKEFEGLRGVLDASLDDLRKIKGVGSSNAFGIKLFQAISERYAKERIPKKITLASPHAVVNYLQEKIGREKKEHFLLIALDTRNNLVRTSGISIGTLNSSLIHPREVFKEAIQANAAKVIVAHNHPGGDPEPSKDDLVITKRLVEAGRIIDIEVIDHIIITKTGFVSFKEKNII